MVPCLCLNWDLLAAWLKHLLLTGTVLIACVELCRVYVSGLMKGGADVFVENLPGFPDNIRPSSSGGYWVAMSVIRQNPGFSMLDFLSDKPWIKKMIFKVTRTIAPNTMKI